MYDSPEVLDFVPFMQGLVRRSDPAVNSRTRSPSGRREIVALRSQTAGRGARPSIGLAGSSIPQRGARGSGTGLERCRVAALALLWTVGCSTHGPTGGAGSKADRDAGSDTGPAPDAGSPKAIYVVPDAPDALAQGAFFDHPWPSDVRRDARGAIRLNGYPNPRSAPLIESYLGTMEGRLDGFSPVAAGYLRFTVALDPASLPATALASLDATSSVQLVDVDPSSPDHGTRRPVELRFVADPGVYWPANTLAFMPAIGAPLRSGVRYALIVTDAVRASDGERVAPSDDLAAVLGAAAARPAIDAERTALTGALTEIAAAGIAREHVVSLAVFTTTDPTRDARVLADWVTASYPVPAADPAQWTAAEQAAGAYDVYEGRYGPAPDFQRGTPPFLTPSDGGDLAFDASGVPVVQRELDLRFALAVPPASTCPMPAAGYPITLYAHGTGGDYRSALGAGHEAEALGKRCVATLGIDQLDHGERATPGGLSPELLFFNLQNPLSSRANGPESSVDFVQLARLVPGLAVPASVARTGAEIRFDAQKILLFGHSQGGINGPMMLATSPLARGAVFSGCSGPFSMTLLEKTQPIDIGALVRGVLLGLVGDESTEVDRFHPALSLAQTIIDPSDPIDYAAAIVREPRSGFASKSVLMTEGVMPDGTGDHYAPPHGIEAMAVTMGLPPEDPEVHPVAELAIGGLQPLTVPAGGVSGNLAGGTASGVLSQWLVAAGAEGHFVTFDQPPAMAQAAQFLANLAADPHGRVPAR